MTSRQAAVSPAAVNPGGVEQPLLPEPVEDIGHAAGAQHLLRRHLRPVAHRLAELVGS